MSQLLKLTGIKSYTSAVTRGVVVKKNEVVRMTDEDASKVVDSHRRDKEGDEVPYFTQPTVKDTTVHHDFTPKAAAPVAKEVKVAPAPAESATGGRVRPAAASQRAARRTAA